MSLKPQYGIVWLTFSKLSLLEAYNVQHMYHHLYNKFRLCFSDDDPRLNSTGNILVRADNLSNNKKSNVGIYFKESVAVRSVTAYNLMECLLLEFFIKNKNNLNYHFINYQVNHSMSFMISYRLWSNSCRT